MTQKGLVEKISGELATVKIFRSSACGESCAACGGCGAKETVIEAKNSIGAKIGDTVMLQMNDKKVLKAAFLVYIIPVFMLILGYVAGQYLTKSENMGILCGFFLLAVSFAFIIFFDRRSKNKYSVYIERIV